MGQQLKTSLETSFAITEYLYNFSNSINPLYACHKVLLDRKRSRRRNRQTIIQRGSSFSLLLRYSSTNCLCYYDDEIFFHISCFNILLDTT